MSMTLRTLKKRSKKAVPWLVKFFGYKPADFFPAAQTRQGENYHGLKIRCAHRPVREAWLPDATYQCCRNCSSTPLKGTPMFGCMSGYETPEWDERTAYEELSNILMWSDRPAGATEDEHRAMLRLTGLKPFDEAEFRRTMLLEIGWGDPAGDLGVTFDVDIDVDLDPEPADGVIDIYSDPRDVFELLSEAAIGTRAPAIMGGVWFKVRRGGWKWNGPDGNGGTFPKPGGDWNGRLIPPQQAKEPTP